MSIDWLEAGASDRTGSTGAFRVMLTSRESTPVVGAYDGISALLAKRAGFEALYLSGAALSASKALPDLGLLTVEDVTRAARDMVRASGLPVLVDCDTGFGEAMNVMRAVRDLEEAGVAGVQIEDQQFPKKCGHLSDKRLVPVEDMCRKIAAARRASRDMVVCARTDAAGDSIADAVDRARAYAEAGADIIFVEALTSEEDFATVRDQVAAPLLANMTEFGHTPQISLARFSELGYELVIYPVSAFRIAARAIGAFYADLHANGSAEGTLPRMMSRKELYEAISYFDYEALDAQIARSVVPD